MEIPFDKAFLGLFWKWRKGLYFQEIKWMQVHSISLDIDGFLLLLKADQLILPSGATEREREDRLILRHLQVS